MKKNIIRAVASVMCSALFLTCFACGDGGETTQNAGNEAQISTVAGEFLYRNGISEYTIVIRDDANNNERLAASELQTNLALSAGTSVSIVTESQCQDPDRIISLGHTKYWKENVDVALTNDNISNSGYYIETIENNIYISCLEQTTRSGIIYGVYDFLYDAVGYEFFAADEIYYRETKEIPLFDYSGFIVDPSYELRMMPHSDLRNDSMSTVRYRLIYPTEGFGFVTYGHSQTSRYLNPDKPCTCGLPGCGGGITYQKHHPDWFGKYGTGDMQLCWTGGAEMERVAAEKFIEFFQQYPEAEYFMFGQADNLGYCDCARCTAAMAEWAGTPSGLQVNFLNNIIERANKWLDENQNGRRVKFIIYAYYGVEAAPVKVVDGQTVPYSEKVDPVDDLYIFFTPIYTNFAFELDSPKNADVYKNLTDWGAIANGQIIYYFYDTNFRSYCINFNNFGTVESMFRMANELGVSCISTQGADAYMPCFREMRSYVESSLMWDVNRSYDELVRKFMNAYYKDAAEYMYRYYMIMRERYTYFQSVIEPSSGDIYGSLNNSQLWTQPVIEKIDAEFDKMLKSIEKYQETDPELYNLLKNRIKKEWVSPLFIKLTVLPSYYTEEEYEEMRAEFKHYVSLFKFTQIKEGHDFGDLLK